MAHAPAPFFVSWPPGAIGGAKRSNIIKSELQSQFQKFLNQTLCIFSQIKDILHISLDFHLDSLVMPRGGTWGTVGVWGVYFFPEIQPDSVYELLT